jgi:hypothetical protein
VESRYQAAIEMAQKQQSKALELRSALSLSKLCDMRGERNRAFESLSVTLAQFKEGFDTPDFQEVQTFLDKFRSP